MHRHIYIQAFTHPHSGQAWLSVTFNSKVFIHAYIHTYMPTYIHIDKQTYTFGWMDGKMDGAERANNLISFL